MDLAEESPRTIVSGLAPYMAMDSLLVTSVDTVSIVHSIVTKHHVIHAEQEGGCRE